MGRAAQAREEQAAAADAGREADPEPRKLPFAASARRQRLFETTGGRYADKGRDWLNVYGKRYAKKETDGLGRSVWYRGERGPLPSTLYEADGAWDSLFLARLPEALFWRAAV